MEWVAREIGRALHLLRLPELLQLPAGRADVRARLHELADELDLLHEVVVVLAHQLRPGVHRDGLERAPLEHGRAIGHLKEGSERVSSRGGKGRFYK